MQSSLNATSRSYPYRHYYRTPPLYTHFPNHVGHIDLPVDPHAFIQNAQVQPSNPNHSALVTATNPASLSNIPIVQHPESSVNPQDPPFFHQHAFDAHHVEVSLKPEISAQFQNYRPPEHTQPIVPMQYVTPFVIPQNPYPNPAIRMPLPQYSNSTTSPSSHTMPGYHTPPSFSSPYTCGICGATFTRPHNRKRHYESQHSKIRHVCKYCRKSFKRVDSLKRHLDRPCDQVLHFEDGAGQEYLL